MVDEQHEHCDVILYQKMDICRVLLKLKEPMIPYNIHSYSGMTKMDITFCYAKKKQKQKPDTGWSVSCILFISWCEMILIKSCVWKKWAAN